MISCRQSFPLPNPPLSLLLSLTALTGKETEACGVYSLSKLIPLESGGTGSPPPALMPNRCGDVCWLFFLPPVTPAPRELLLLVGSSAALGIHAVTRFRHILPCTEGWEHPSGRGIAQQVPVGGHTQGSLLPL